MKRGDSWTRDQLLLALRLYMRLPFGKLHQRNPDIIELAKQIGRTPSAVAMKASNFASLDPDLQKRNIKGLESASRADKEVWAEFANNSEALAADAETAYARLNPTKDAALLPGETAAPSPEAPPRPRERKSFEAPEGPTEIERTIRARRVQSFFRAAVLTSYEHRCAISGLAVPDLLTASHILPWHHDVARRADPTNGLCLNALFDRAFDRGLIAVGDDMRVIASPHLTAALRAEIRLGCSLADVEGLPLIVPSRFPPDTDALSWHRGNVFKA